MKRDIIRNDEGSINFSIFGCNIVTLLQIFEGSPMRPPTWVFDRLQEIIELGHWTFKYKYNGTAELGRLTGGRLKTVLALYHLEFLFYYSRVKVGNLSVIFSVQMFL